MANYYQTGMTSDEHREVIYEKVGDISGYKLLANYVFLGIYNRPEKTKSGLFLTPSTLKEDDFQGKIGLILAVGPKAFDEEWVRLRGDVVPKVGDWVEIKVYGTDIKHWRGTMVRTMTDEVPMAILDHPEMVY